MEKVDSNGLLPLRATDRVFTRRLPLPPLPPEDPAGSPGRFPRGGPARRAAAQAPRRAAPRDPPPLAGPLRTTCCPLPIDHSVAPVPGVAGGNEAAAAVLERFLEERLGGYGEGRNHPDEEMSSGLSPYLHFGHVSPHQVFAAVASWEEWTPERLGQGARGAVEGWWGMSPAAEKFLDEAITWREVGYNMASHQPDYDQYELAAGMGAADARRSTSAIPVRTSTPWRNSRPPAPTTRSGTRPRRSSSARGASTTTCGCSGARRSSTGRRARGRRWRC